EPVAGREREVRAKRLAVVVVVVEDAVLVEEVAREEERVPLASATRRDRDLRHPAVAQRRGVLAQRVLPQDRPGSHALATRPDRVARGIPLVDLRLVTCRVVVRDVHTPLVLRDLGPDVPAHPLLAPPPLLR